MFFRFAPPNVLSISSTHCSITVSDRLEWKTVNSVPLSDRGLLRSLHEHVQEQRAFDHRGDHTHGDTGGSYHPSDAVAHDEE